MTEEEFAESFAEMQAMALTNRHLLSCLYEIILKDDPEADAKLRRISDELIPFLEIPTNPGATANLTRLVDGFLATLRQRITARRGS